MRWTTSEPVDRLRRLLGPPPKTPWGALIPQLLLWSFRRFCIQNLPLLINGEQLADYMWDSHLDLVDRYAPSGLKDVVHTWITPTTILEVHSPLEEYNEFLMECIQDIDASLTIDSEEQDAKLSEFLDETIYLTIQAWLRGGPTQAFFIFPSKRDNPNEFSQIRFLQLIQTLLAFRAPEPEVAPAPVVKEQPLPLEYARPPVSSPSSAPPPSSEPIAAPLPILLPPPELSTRPPTPPLPPLEDTVPSDSEEERPPTPPRSISTAKHALALRRHTMRKRAPWPPSLAAPKHRKQTRKHR